MANYPASIGKYRIHGLVGKGGMGAVFKAEHPTLQRTVILKKLTITGNADFEERFKREAQIMMDLRHENIVQVFDHFKEKGQFYLVMEFVDGITLEDLIRERRFLSHEAALLILYETSMALQYAHERMVIHRDIKPANILISKEGVVKLVDFGVSTTLEESEDDNLTKAGMTIGTPAYLAPEQISNAKRRDKRADIYALGVLYYEMVVGKKPFLGAFSPELIRQIEKGQYQRPRKINPKIKPVVERMIRKAMHKKVTRRYQDLAIWNRKLGKLLKRYATVEERQKGIQQYLEGVEPKLLESRTFLPEGWGARLSIVGLVLLLLGGTAGWSYLQGYHYEYLQADEVGALQLFVTLKEDSEKLPESLFIRSYLYTDNGGKLTQVESPALHFSLKQPTSQQGYLTFQSNRVYLPEQGYKLKLNVENQQFQRNFYLAPRVLQKSSDPQNPGLQLYFAQKDPAQPLPLDLEVKLMDRESGRSLHDEASIFIKQHGEWIPWPLGSGAKKPEILLVSGVRYFFKATAPNYRSTYPIATVRPDQTRLELEVGLIPNPGTLVLRSSGRGFSAKINNSHFYLSGGVNRTREEINVITTNPQELSLAPGEYFITVEWSSNFWTNISGTQRVEVKSGEKTSISVDHDESDQVIHFKTE